MIKFKLLTICLLASALLCNGLLANQSIAAEQDTRITVAGIEELLASGESIVFIDTRNRGQWASASDKITGAMRLTNNDDLAQLVKDYPANTAIVTYCT
ncbi:MAG: hypothetical protein OET90_06340 [Desulfuromonadales bacterium]|nr:hypothetical protein [Desulfuromonadales bacterium]